MRRRALRALPAVVLAALLVGGWELYVDLAGVEPALLPAPHDVASSLWNSGELLLRNFSVTAEEVVLGLAVALVAVSRWPSRSTSRRSSVAPSTRSRSDPRHCRSP